MAGVEDFAHHRSQTTATFDGMGSIEQREIGPDIYVKMSGSVAEAQRGQNPTKPWLHIHTVNDLATGTLSDIFGGANADPTEGVKLLTSVTSSVAAVGIEDVRNQQSMHYRTTIAEAKISQALDEQMGDCKSKADDPTGNANIPLDVWLDGQGRMTRMQISIPQGASPSKPSSTPLSTPTPNAAGPASITIEFYDYDAPVSIEAPPAAQTQTINDTSLNSTNSSNSCMSASFGASPS